MDLFDLLALLGGLCLFLFGMNVMGDALERSAGSKLEMILARLTTNKFAGFLTGLAVTGVIQSSSATTVMVVGFVNSGIMQLGQAIGVIMGANIGTILLGFAVLMQGKCTIEAGFIWNDILTDLERTSDHCSNIAGSISGGEHIHEALGRKAPGFDQRYTAYAAKYLNI